MSIGPPGLPNAQVKASCPRGGWVADRRLVHFFSGSRPGVGSVWSNRVPSLADGTVNFHAKRNATGQPPCQADQPIPLIMLVHSQLSTPCLDGGPPPCSPLISAAQQNARLLCTASAPKTHSRVHRFLGRVRYFRPYSVHHTTPCNPLH